MNQYFYPVLPSKDYYIASGFLDPAYLRVIGAQHPGEDWNGNGGGDSDLSDPIYAITDGVCLSARFWPVWGNVALFQLPGPGVWWQIAHCQKLLVKAGDKVTPGQKIATIGKGAPDKLHPAGRYLAHLHTEIRLFGPDQIPPNSWPSLTLGPEAAAAEIRRTRVPLSRFLQKNNAQTVLS